MECSVNGQILKWNNTTKQWGCASDLDTVDLTTAAVIRDGNSDDDGYSTNGANYLFGGCFTITDQKFYVNGKVATFSITARNNGTCTYQNLNARNNNSNSSWYTGMLCYPPTTINWFGGFHANGNLVPSTEGDVCPDPIIGVIANSEYLPYADQTFSAQYIGYSDRTISDRSAGIWLDRNGAIAIDFMQEGYFLPPGNTITVGGTYLAK